MRNIDERRRGQVAQIKSRVQERDRFTCQYCGYSVFQMNEIRGLVADHIIPVVYGGRTTYDNLVCCCNICNGFAHDSVFETIEHKTLYILNRFKFNNKKHYLSTKTIDEIEQYVEDFNIEKNS